MISVLLRWAGRAWSQPVRIVDQRRVEALWQNGDALWALGERGEIHPYDSHEWEGIAYEGVGLGVVGGLVSAAALCRAGGRKPRSSISSEKQSLSSKKALGTAQPSVSSRAGGRPGS